MKTRTNASLFVVNSTDRDKSTANGGGLTLGGAREPRVSRILADQRDFILRYHKVQQARQRLRDAKSAIGTGSSLARK